MALQDQFNSLRGEKQQTPSDLLDNTRIVVHRGLTMPFVRDDLAAPKALAGSNLRQLYGAFH